VPPQLLERAFGKHGRSLWRKANALDDRPVEPYHDRKSISTERTFHTDTTDVRWLRDQLTAMAGRLTFELREQQKLTSCVAVKIRYSDFNTFTRQRRIPYTASDHTLIRMAHELLEQVYQRRQLVRLVGLRFSELVHGSPQLDLFDPAQEDERLLQALDRIRRRFGAGAIGRAVE
jgi:DNA polymerase-4